MNFSTHLCATILKSYNMNERKLILYFSMSLDGFLATKDDDLSWLSIVEREGEDYGYAAFNETVDTYIVGSRTYEKVLSMTGGVFPPANQHTCYVINRQDRESENGVSFYNKGVEQLIKDLKSKNGKNIFCDGGAMVVKMLMDKNLIDEYSIAIIPIILGDGKRLFRGETPRIELEAISSKHYESGLTTLYYKKK